MSDSLWLYSPWNSPGQNTEKGSLSLLQGIFPTQGSNPGLLHCRRILYQLSHKGSPKIAKVILKKRNRAGGITLRDFRQGSYKAIIIQTAWYWHKNRHVSQWNREPRNKPTHLWSINLNKGGKALQWEKDSFFSKWYWESWTAAYKSMKLEHTLIPYTKMNLKWLKDLRRRHDTIKVLEETLAKHSLA